MTIDDAIQIWLKVGCPCGLEGYADPVWVVSQNKASMQGKGIYKGEFEHILKIRERPKR